MKKRIYLILLSITVIFFSCKDNSGKFTEQLFTDSEISYALKQCIDSVALHTCNILCVSDTINKKCGYYYYDSVSYRIGLPAAAKSIVDTLIKHEFGDRIDTLIFNMNRAAELCGNKIMNPFWKTICDTITFPKPHSILHGGNSAITNYVKQTRETEFISVLVNSILIEQFNDLNVISEWNELQKEYYIIDSVYVSIDIVAPAAQQMVAGFFKVMALEEEAIRNNPNLQGSPNGLLYRVFATLKKP